MIFIVTKGSDEQNHEEIKVSTLKDKGAVGKFIADWETSNNNEVDAEIIGVFKGEQLQYSTNTKVEVKFI